jgi:hypothetical protein
VNLDLIPHHDASSLGVKAMPLLLTSFNILISLFLFVHLLFLIWE